MRPIKAAGHPINQRLEDLEIAKAIGIVLVVLGHLVAVRSTGPDWYADFKTVIYQFHMPLFMYLSGFAFGLSSKSGTKIQYTLRRADRLLVPFFAFGIIIVIGKYIAQIFLMVDNAPSGIISGFANLFVYTNSSAALSIWYVFVLFFLSVTFKITEMYKHGRVLLAMAFCFSIYPVDIQDHLYMNRVGMFAIFFAVGIFLSSNYKFWKVQVQSNAALFFLIFLFSLTYFHLSGESSKFSMLVAGGLAIPAVHGLAMRLTGTGLGLALSGLGSWSFSIYLLNTIIIGLTSSAYALIGGFSSFGYWPFFVVATAAGIGVPIIVARAATAMSPRIARYIV